MRFRAILSSLVSPLIRRLTMHPRQPVVVILGATGTGKSKLAIEIARKYNGEIISADSMQVYKELDIVTNKVTAEEQNLAKHHLINFVDPLTRISVVDFKNRALEITNQLHDAGKLPVIVGGTNYYIESVLWDVLVQETEPDEKFVFERDEQEILQMNGIDDQFSEETLSAKALLANPVFADSFKNISSEHLHKLLGELDPESASRYHPKNKRRIIRCLQVVQRTGKKYSDIINGQMTSDGGSQLGGPLRFRNAVFFWLTCQKEVLHARLDTRVDSMIEQGLLKELLDFHAFYNKLRLETNSEPDYTKGIFQAIGFKEFHEYLISADDGSDSRALLFQTCLEEMKRVTRKYSKIQLKWIRNRFIRANDREVPDIYELDTTDVNEWNSKVRDNAFRVMDYFLDKKPLPESLRPVERPATRTSNLLKKNFYCELCDKTLEGSDQWEIHLQARMHLSKGKERKIYSSERFKVSNQ